MLVLFRRSSGNNEIDCQTIGNNEPNIGYTTPTTSGQYK
jgi:hypothetical protein